MSVSRRSLSRVNSTGPVSTWPAWRRALAPMQWHRFSGTSLGNEWQSPVYHVDRDPIARAAWPNGIGRDNESQILGWSGMALRQRDSVVVLCGGGHPSAANPIFGLRLEQDAPTVEELEPCTRWADMDGYQTNSGWRYFRDKRPIVGHLGYIPYWCDPLDALVRHRSGVPAHGTGGSPNIDVWKWSGGWVQPTVNLDMTQDKWVTEFGESQVAGNWENPACHDPSTGDFYALGRFDFWKWTLSTRTFSKLSVNLADGGSLGWLFDWLSGRGMFFIVCVPERRRIYGFRVFPPPDIAVMLEYDMDSNFWSFKNISVTGDPTMGAFWERSKGSLGFTDTNATWDSANKKMYICDRLIRIYEANLDTAALTGPMPVSGDLPRHETVALFNKFQYVSKLRGIVQWGGHIKNQPTPSPPFDAPSDNACRFLALE